MTEVDKSIVPTILDEIKTLISVALNMIISRIGASMRVVSCDGYRILREKRLKERKNLGGGLMSEKAEGCLVSSSFVWLE